MAVNFARWAVVAHKDDTGFGRQAADIRSVLGLGWHVVIPSERLSDHPLDPATDRRLSRGDPVARVEEVLRGLEGIVFFERGNWHPELLRVARRLGVRTVCVPNWEWFAPRAPEWEACDLFVCTSDFAESVVRRCGWRNTARLPWPLDLARFPARQVTGPARLFVHNAGLVDPDDRKGTRDTIAAFMRARPAGARLLVRLQKPVPLPEHDERVEVRVGNVAEPAALYSEGECAIQPSKMEGNGFMVIEPVASGLPVITLDYPPMSEVVQQPAMRVRKLWFKRRAFPTAWVKHAHLRLPSVGDLAARIAWCATHDLTEISRQNRAWAEERFGRERVAQAWRTALAGLGGPRKTA